MVLCPEANSEICFEPQVDRVARIKACAKGRWQEVFERLGMDSKHFERPNRPCPLCGGKDRFTYFAKESDGGWFCRHCGHGDGIALVQRALGTDFPQTLKRLETILGLPVDRSQDRQWEAKKKTREIREESRRITTLQTIWARALPISVCADDPTVEARGDNPVLRYLRRRGLGDCDQSREIRWLPDEPYWSADEDDRPRICGHYPVMLARVTDDDGQIAALHRTYLTQDGKKAPVPSAKKLSAGKIGSAFIRLFPASNLLCLAEGIETALSVHMLSGLPVWSVISLSGFKRFERVPKGVDKLFIYGDNDESFTGAAGAFELAARLRREHPELTVDVRLPEVPGEDWNDVLLKRLMARETTWEKAALKPEQLGH